MIDYLKSLKWVDYFLFCIIDPRRLQSLISRKEGNPILISFLVIMSISIIEIVSISLIGTESQFFYYKITYGWIQFIFLMILAIFVIASLLDLFCQLRDHQGNIRQILYLISVSMFPRAFLLPLVAIFKVLNFAPIFFYVLFSFLLFIWQALIIIQGISEMHQIKFGESLLIFLSPFLLVGLILFFSLILFVINFVGFLSLI